MTTAAHTQVIKTMAAKLAFTHNMRSETMDQKFQFQKSEILILGEGGNRSARRKPTKAGMESGNQIHIQPLASYIGVRKVFEH